MSSNNALNNSQKNNPHNSSLRNHPHNSSQKNLISDISQRGNTTSVPLSGRIPPLNLRNITENQSLPIHNDKERFNSWPEDADYLLENIRCNSIILSDYHKTQYFVLQSRLKYFRIPIIIISAFASVLNIGLQPYLDQSYISVLCAMLSLITGLIGSIELFLQVQKKMENELMNSRDFYLNAIDIYKVLSLEPEHRNGDGLKYLDGKFAVYCKMIENSNIINKSIQDQLAPIDSNMIEKILSNTSCNGDVISVVSSKHYGDSGANGSTKKPRNSIYKSMAIKKEKRNNTWTEQFMSYFFNQPIAVKESRELKRSGSFDNMLQKYDERLRSSSINTMNNPYKPSISNLYRSSPRQSPAYKNSDMESVVSDMDSIDTTERFDIYCKIIEKAELFDDEILEEIAQIMSFNNEIFSLEERVRIYCHILQHQDSIGGKNVMNGLKNILIGDYFQRKPKNEPMDMENQLKLFKSLMYFKDALGPSTIEKIKQFMMQNVKNQSKSSSEIKQGMMQKLFNMNFQGPRPTDPKNEDIETGKDISRNDIDKYIKQQISEIFNYEDNSIPLVPLNRGSRSRTNSVNKSEKYDGKTSLMSMKKMFDPIIDSSRQGTPIKIHKKNSDNSKTGETKTRGSSWTKYLRGNREDVPEPRRFSGYGKPSPHPSTMSLAQKNTEPEKHSSSDSEDWISYSNHGAPIDFIVPSHPETKSTSEFGVEGYTERSTPDPNATVLRTSALGSSDQTSPVTKLPLKLVVEGLRPSDQNIIMVTTELADSITGKTTPPSAPISTHAHFTTDSSSVNLFTPGDI